MERVSNRHVSMSDVGICAFTVQPCSMLILSNTSVSTNNISVIQ